jgi:hypothetical protein
MYVRQHICENQFIFTQQLEMYHKHDVDIRTQHVELSKHHEMIMLTSTV